MPGTLQQTIRNYGLESVPESVRRLTKLVASQNASTEEIAKVISSDKELTTQLLRAANPSADHPSEYTVVTVEDALMRAGTGWALTLAMSEPLTRAVTKTFRTMLGVELQLVPFIQMDPLHEEHVLCTTSFSGKATGTVSARMTLPLAREFGARLLGMTPDELTDECALMDALGELSNMIAGNFKSNLCDAGLSCQLELPVVRRTETVLGKKGSAGSLQQFGFREGAAQVFVELSVNPWGD
jgi:chemotaxis protein CheX